MASFDENGKYIKTNWKAGDKITATKLNKIEESIEAVNDNDISRHVEADARLDALEAKDVAHDKEFTNVKNTIADNKAAAELGDYEINSRMQFLEQELNEGIEEVHNVASTVDGKIDAAVANVNNVASTVDDKIAAAENNMATQVNQGKADMEAMVAEVESELEGINTNINKFIKKDIVSVHDYGAVGDKIYDDTQAIKDALKNGRYVTAKGEKHYIITDMITIPKHATLDFNNAYVTFSGDNACFKMSNSTVLKNVRINIPTEISLSKSVVYIDGNDMYHVGQNTQPRIENIVIDQNIDSSDNPLYRTNIGIWLDANQETANTTCCITGVLVENVTAKLLKHVIYLSAKDQPNNTSKVYITSNTFRNIFAYNCACFIKDEVLEGSSEYVGIGSSIYENVQFQPADDKETCFIDLCGTGNSFVNPIFWDNSRPSNETDQIILRGNYNYISGPGIPPVRSTYVNNMGNYNFYQGSTYGIPTQYFGGKYISGRGYQKEWKDQLLRTEHIYQSQIVNKPSGTIENSNDVETMFMPLTYGDLGTGYTRIHFKSFGDCDKSTQVRRFWMGIHDTDYRCGGSLTEAYAEQFDCDATFVIRKYEGYANVALRLKVILNESLVLNKVFHETVFNITNDKVINPRLRLGSTTAGGSTQIYEEITIFFYE